MIIFYLIIFIDDISFVLDMQILNKSEYFYSLYILLCVYFYFEYKRNKSEFALCVCLYYLLKTKIKKKMFRSRLEKLQRSFVQEACVSQGFGAQLGAP